MNKLILVLACAASLFAQTGTVIVTADVPAVAPVAGSAAIPGSFIATANSVVCKIAGNAVPATAAVINCTLGLTAPVSTAAFTLQLPANSNFTLAQGLIQPTGNDIITVIFQSSATGVITFQAVASPAVGASSGQVNGSL